MSSHKPFTNPAVNFSDATLNLAGISWVSQPLEYGNNKDLLSAMGKGKTGLLGFFVKSALLLFEEKYKMVREKNETNLKIPNLKFQFSVGFFVCLFWFFCVFVCLHLGFA